MLRILKESKKTMECTANKIQKDKRVEIRNTQIEITELKKLLRPHNQSKCILNIKSLDDLTSKITARMDRKGNLKNELYNTLIQKITKDRTIYCSNKINE